MNESQRQPLRVQSTVDITVAHLLSDYSESVGMLFLLPRFTET